MTSRARLILGCTLLGLAVLLPVVGLMGMATDDVFITYRYAWNLSDGAGFAFNPGERVFAASDPGIVIILAALRLATGVETRLLGTVVTAGALCLVAALALREALEVGRGPEAIAGGLLLVLSPFLWLGQGSGPMVALALLVVGVTLADRRPIVAGLVCGFAVWCRPDALVGLGLVCALLWFRSRRTSVRFCFASAAPVAIGLGLARAYFGSWLPVTLSIKSKLAVTEHLAASASALWTNALDLFGYSQGPLARWLLVLGACGSVVMAKRAPVVGRFLVLYACLMALLYSLLRLPLFSWYVAPAVVATLLGGAWGAGEIIRGAFVVSRRSTFRGLLYGAAGLACGLVLVTTLWSSVKWARHRGSSNWRLVAYRAAGEWLAEHTAKDADVALDEVGMIGYFGQRRVLDLVGLVSPGSVPFSTVGDPTGAFLVKPTQYLVSHTMGARTAAIVRRPWFASAYREVAHLEPPGFAGSLTVYERVSAGAIPGSRGPLSRAARMRRAKSP